jgi:predicted ester cyclase
MYNEVNTLAESEQHNKNIILAIYNRSVSCKKRSSSLNALNQFLDHVASAFPDYTLNIENLIVNGNKVMVRYAISGTHKGNFMGMEPTDKQMLITGIDVFRLENGQVMEYWEGAFQIGAAR